MLTLLGSWRRFLALALVGVLTASLGAVLTRSAEAANTAPAEIRLESITSTFAAPSLIPSGAIPYVLALAAGVTPPGELERGMRLTVTVSLLDSSGRRAASFSTDTTLTVTSNQGTVTNIETVAKAGEGTATLTVSIPKPANQVSLTVTAPGGKRPLSDTATGDQRFDVVSQLSVEPAKTGISFEAGIGGSDKECTEATPDDPVCGIVILPQGATSPEVLLSLGPCDGKAYSGCGDARGSVVQTLVGLEKGYSRTSPATILVKCDKTLCGVGSIQSKLLNFTPGGNTALTQAAACPAKETVGPFPQIACVDYVQSKRDGSGDTLLYLLFVKDARVSVR